MRYFTKEDLESDAALNLTYTSSRLMYEDIQSSMSNESEEKKMERKSEDQNARSSISNRPSSGKSRSKSEKLVPSFFSRTYVSWNLLTEKMNVYTPVRLFILFYLF